MRKKWGWDGKEGGRESGKVWGGEEREGTLQTNCIPSLCKEVKLIHLLFATAWQVPKVWVKTVMLTSSRPIIEHRTKIGDKGEELRRVTALVAVRD